MSTMGTCRICGEYCNMLSNYKCHECRRQEHFNKSETKQETNLDALINKLSAHGGKLVIIKDGEFKQGQLNQLVRQQDCCSLDNNEWLILTGDK